MEGVLQVVLILALHWQPQLVNAQDANTQCEKSFNTNYGQVSNQDFANATCSQMKIRVNGMEPILLLCPYFMLKIGEQEYCMTVSWTDRDRNITTLVAQNTKKKKKKSKRNTSKKKKIRRKGKDNAVKNKNTGSRKEKGGKNKSTASKNGKRRKRNTKRNVKASKKKHKNRANTWEEKIRLPRALKKQKMTGTLQRVNKTRKRPSTKTVRPKTKTFKKGTKRDYGRFEMKSFVASYCGTDIPYGLNAFDGIVNIDIVPSPNTTIINRQEIITNNEGSGGGETSDDNIVTSSLGTQGTVPQQIPEAGGRIHPDIVFQCFWSPSAP